jgi:parallel beta-helix repeat protein
MLRESRAHWPLWPLVLLFGCSTSSSSPSPATDPACTAAAHCTFIAAGTSEDAVQTIVAKAKAGDTIEFGAGTFAFTNEITLAADQLSMKGAGIDQTILDFKAQASGSEGIFAQSVKDLHLEGFTVRDTKGNAIKVLGATGLTVRSIKTLWTADDSSSHGAYGVYPVQSTNVLVEKCVATGASDTGVYVGQSQNVVIRNNEAHDNVAGIEIENTFAADVYGNDSHDNTAGILVFDLPDLQQLGGRDIRVHDNHIHDNNTSNFAPAGNIVGMVPAGTGFFVMANSNVEVFGNTFENNQTAQLSVISYYVTQIDIKDPKYYPYPRKVYFHDNTLSGGGTKPDLKNRLGLLLLTGKSKFPNGNVPDVLYDGIVDSNVAGGSNDGGVEGGGGDAGAGEGGATNPNAMQICVHQPGAVFGNLHMDKLDTNNPDLSKTIDFDVSPFDCMLPPVAAVSFPGL